MFEITVFKLHSDKFAKSQASHRQVLVDHLEASADRNGFEVSWDDQGDMPAYGSLWRDGREVGIWKIEEVKA
jgi:hypothetical protein